MGQDNIKQDFCYVPSHLHHMVFELLKNSLRAVVERYGLDCDNYPDIKVVFAEGERDITIKISDEGCGISRKGMACFINNRVLYGVIFIQLLKIHCWILRMAETTLKHQWLDLVMVYRSLVNILDILEVI